MIRLAQRMHSAPLSATLNAAARARALRAEGIDVISLALGEPDFSPPQEALAAAMLAGERGDTNYPPIGGTPALVDAVVRKFARENGLAFDAEQILIANGGKQCIFNAFAATLDPYDEVVVPVPYWVSYPIIAGMMGANIVHAACHEQDGFALSAEQLRTAITPRTKWVVLNFPNNPSGATLDIPALKAIAEVLRKAPHVLILSDEIYEHLTYDGVKAISLLTLAPDLADRLLIVNGVSKAFAMTGWRVGYAAGPRGLIGAMRRVQGNATSGVCTLAQAGAAAALNCDTPERIKKITDLYRHRRDGVVAGLRALPGVTCACPTGAFYVFPNFSTLIGGLTPKGRWLASDVDLAEALLEEAHVATVPGSAFGMSGHLRLSFATDEKLIKAALERITIFVQTLGAVKASV